jgi:hypothetical protein
MCLSVTSDVALHTVMGQSGPSAFASLQAVLRLLHPSSKTVDAAGGVHGVPDVIITSTHAGFMFLGAGREQSAAMWFLRHFIATLRLFLTHAR